jgi:predicted GTPase
MDLVVDDEYSKHDFARAVQEQIEVRFPMLRKTPVVAMSSLLGHNVKKLMPTVFEARDRWARVIPTGMNTHRHHRPDEQQRSSILYKQKDDHLPSYYSVTLVSSR